jgi:hypothetical protein
VAKAQEELTNSTLKQKAEGFAEWRGRFMRVQRLVKLPNNVMLGYARKLLRPSLADRALIRFNDKQDYALVKFLDAA